MQAKSYFLIDYENVGADGLRGCKKLDASARIVIFFTSNARKLDMSSVADHGAAAFDMIEVASGKQQVDIHIASYLGYIAGMQSGEDVRIVIVSEDADYDKLIRFWTKKPGIEIKRVGSIGAGMPKAEKTRKTAPVEDGSKEKLSPKAKLSPKTKRSPKEKMKINTEVSRALQKAGYPNDTIGSITSIVARNLERKDVRNSVYEAIVRKYGQEEGQRIYTCTKTFL